MIRGPILILALLATPAPAADLTTLAGARVVGTLVAAGPKGVTLKPEGAPAVTTPATEVAAVAFGKPEPAGLPRHDEVELVDGSTIRVKDLGVTGKAVALTPLKPGVSFELPLASLAWVARGADDAESLKAFRAVVAGRGKRDLFVVKSARGLNPLPGTVLGGTEAGDTLDFERENGQRVPLKLNRATGGLVFNQPPRAVVPPTLCRVTDRAGNALVAQSIRVEGGKVEVITVAGAVARYDSIVSLEKLDFAQGNVRYLADLGGRADLPPPEEDGPLGKQFPVLARVALDQAVGGGAITLDGTAHARGVSVPPGVSVAYPLAGNYREFRCTVGVQDGVNRQSVEMRLRVELDGRAVFDETIKKSAGPRELALDVRGARELRVTVERAGAALEGDQLNLADARVQK